MIEIYVEEVELNAFGVEGKGCAELVATFDDSELDKAKEEFARLIKKYKFETITEGIYYAITIFNNDDEYEEYVTASDDEDEIVNNN